MSPLPLCSLRSDFPESRRSAAVGARNYGAKKNNHTNGREGAAALSCLLCKRVSRENAFFREALL